MSITKDQLTKSSSALPVGEYLLEITNAKDVGGIGQNGKPWEKVNLTLKVLEPKEHANRVMFAGTWYDATLGNILGAKLDSVFGKSNDIDKDKLIATLPGIFFKAKVGIDAKGYNTIASVLKEKEESV